ncbi:hypothetical protein Pan54_39560 [Rubinisphaera italica]|uniref:DUF1207 domain-containing protein n=2 Tax=Rubinisphaera italica TaxID=2527969 RepID=A0A5C5XLC0_9PLAN|nr:hypothetical protein Pan54_39560 [Rubinisphaera italica]
MFYRECGWDTLVFLCTTMICLCANPELTLGQLHKPEVTKFPYEIMPPPAPGVQWDRNSDSEMLPGFPKPDDRPSPLELSDPSIPEALSGQPYSSSVPQPPVALPLPGGHTFESGNGPYFSENYGTTGQEQWLNSPSAMGNSQSYPTDDYCLDGYCDDGKPWQWTLLPAEVLYKSYLGGPREPRFASNIAYLKGTGWIWELESGGRAGLLRYGTTRHRFNEGWQLDIWGAAFPRLNFVESLDVDAVDFKVGVPITWTKGRFQAKMEWYHISSHLGDEFLLKNPGFNRLDYLRDSIVLGGGFFPTPDVRIYADADYAYNTNGGAEPWHFQFGVDYSPICVSEHGIPQPFMAVNGLIRQEVNYSGGVNFVAGWQWRGHEKDSLFRAGIQYYAGQSLQLSFLNEYEELLGFGLWYDF